MKKILFLAEAVSLAHVGRPLVLAKWANKYDYEIHFACSAEGLNKTNASPQEFNLHSLTTIRSQLFYDRVNSANFFYTPTELKGYVHEEIQLIKKVNPDLIVSDFRLRLTEKILYTFHKN
jgi:UDP:flavonoid glycosyltransferase YjiC (YdhE family)